MQVVGDGEDVVGRVGENGAVGRGGGAAEGGAGDGDDARVEGESGGV